MKMFLYEISGPCDTDNFIVLAADETEALEKLNSWIDATWNKRDAESYKKKVRLQSVEDKVFHIQQSWD